MPISVVRLTVWPLAIPLRRQFGHAAAARNVAQPLIAAIELSDGTIGYGETHPRPYVSGETRESVIECIRDRFVRALLDFRAENFPEVLEFADSLPFIDDAGQPITAARAAVELALIDACSRSFRRPLDEVAGWIGAAGLGDPGSLHTVRYSGVVGGDDPARVARSIRKMRCFGLRDFKLKVGDSNDDARVRAAVRTLGRSLRHGRTTLRLDANGAWTVEKASERLQAWSELPIACVEQPLPRGRERDFLQCRARSRLPLMADESLVTPDDAEALIVNRTVTWFNIRLSKNGGFLPSIRLALTAAKHEIVSQMGCMVGETSILSAVGRAFLRLVPRMRFAEGSYGRFLLRGDVVRRPVRFGYGGRGVPLASPGWGVDVQPERLRAWCETAPVNMPL